MWQTGEIISNVARRLRHDKQSQARRRRAAQRGRGVRALYFERLVDRLGRQTDDLELEGGAYDVRMLLAELHSWNPGVAPNRADDVVKVTVNKQLASLETIGFTTSMKLVLYPYAASLSTYTS
jgi:hypothetical protein